MCPLPLSQPIIDHGSHMLFLEPHYGVVRAIKLSFGGGQG